MSEFDIDILNESELTALEQSCGDDCDMAAVRCVVRELRRLRSDAERGRKDRDGLRDDLDEANRHLAYQRERNRTLANEVTRLNGLLVQARCPRCRGDFRYAHSDGCRGWLP